MFDKYMIVEDGFRNVGDSGTPTGFQLKARLPYYRGLGLSMVEDISVTVDGTTYPPEAVRLTLRDKSWALAELEHEYDECWEFGEVGTVTIAAAGGLSPGPHRIELVETVRISYRPGGPSPTRDEKTLELAAA